MSTTQVSQSNVDPKVLASIPGLDEKRVPKASKSDNAMYHAMMSLLSSIGRSEEVGASLADLSKTLYDTLVTSGTKRVEELQDELEFLNVFLEEFDNIQEYGKWEDKVKELKEAIAILEPILFDEDGKRKPNSGGPYEALYWQYVESKTELSRIEDKPPALPEKYADRKDRLVELSKTYTKLSSARTYVNGVSQQLSSENQMVASNKQLPDAIQSQVKTMVLEQGVLVGQMMSFLRILQRQLQRG